MQKVPHRVWSPVQNHGLGLRIFHGSLKRWRLNEECRLRRLAVGYFNTTSHHDDDRSEKNPYNSIIIQSGIKKNILVVGLGNETFPGTRHNMGMILLDHLVLKHLQLQWTAHSAGGWIASIPSTILLHSSPFSIPYTAFERIHFLKPRTFMNLSGIAVAKASKEFDIPPENMLIIHDDLDRALGKVSLKKGGSASGHNGVKSIIQKCKTQEFPRLRIGIGRPHDPRLVQDFVLSVFTATELETIDETVKPLFLKQFYKLIMT